MRAILTLGQPWVDRDGAVWTVRQIHRKDWMAQLESPGGRRSCVLFAELGRDYRPLGDEAVSQLRQLEGGGS